MELAFCKSWYLVLGKVSVKAIAKALAKALAIALAIMELMYQKLQN